ncbi:MAG: permease, partial [Anaerolineaceae bacterium]|nr:permease [Anaerolineaceae bacterium]
YKSLARQLSLENHSTPVRLRRNRVIMPLATVHRGSLAALRYAHSLSDDVTVIHVSIDEKETEKVKAKWAIWGEGTRLIVLSSPYRVFIEPLLDYIEKIDKVGKAGDLITIVVPQFVPKHWWTSFLHTRTADTLRKVLLNHDNIVITEVPYQVH